MRKNLVAVSLLVLGLALQTTLFSQLRLFDAAPALVLLLVIAVARHLDEQVALLAGFFTGLAMDGITDSKMGLWALVGASVAFVTVRLRDRVEDDFSLIGPMVFVTSFAALALYALLGTIVGLRILTDPGAFRNMLLPAVYNLVLATVIVPLTTMALGAARRRDPGFLI